MMYTKFQLALRLAATLTVLFCCNAFSVPQIEGRFIELQNTYNKAEWTTISFSQVYDEPPAVFMLSTSQGSNPAIVKIRNVTRTGFEALPLEPSGEDGPHITMGAHYLAIAYGVHEFPDGDIVEVGKMQLGPDTIQASPKSPWYGVGGLTGSDESRYAEVQLETDFGEQPVFFHSIQTLNNQIDVNGKKPPNEHLLPYLTIAAKYDAVGSNLTPAIPQLDMAYFIALEASETEFGPVSRDETVAYLATTEGFGRSFFDDSGKEVEWEADFAETRIKGWSDGCFRNNFKNNYSQTPLVAASKISRNGNEGGWLRSCAVNNNLLGLRVDEDRSEDNERRHPEEDASILAMTSEFVFSGNLPSCDVAFPGALATFGGSDIFLSSRSRIIDENDGALTTFDLRTDANGQGNNLPDCGVNGRNCFATNTDALTDSQARAIPTLDIQDTGPEIGTTLAGDYFFKRQTVVIGPGDYNVVAPTRIYIADAGGELPTLLTIASASINVEDGAYLAIYVDGDVVIDGANPNALILAKGQIRFTNVLSGNLVGRFTAGAGITTDDTLLLTANNVPTAIPGICGREVIEVLNHYRFEMADNKGSSCAAKSVTLKACADVDCNLLYSQPSTVGLLPASGNNYTWSPTDNVSFTGQTSLNIESLKGNDPVLATSGETPSSQLRCFIGGKEVTLGSCKIDFKKDGMVFKNITDGNDVIVSQISGKPSDVGFNKKTYAVEACEASDLLRDNEIEVDMNYNCSSSGNCSNQMLVSNNNKDYTLGLSPTAVPLLFNSDSQAIITVQYPDAGEVSLSASIAGRSGVAGSSNLFTVRPFGFATRILNNAKTGPNANAYAFSANDSLLALTGEEFVLELRATQWVEGEDTNEDGIPDDFSVLDNNISAEHFSGTVSLTPTAILPAAGVTGNLALSASSTGGTAQVVFNDEPVTTVGLNYDEVGTIGINARAPYLTSTLVQGQLANVGRFAPANFALTGNVDAACEVGQSFTYFDQPISNVSYTLSALNHNGQRTSNYRGGFDKLFGLEMVIESDGVLLNRLANVDAISWPQSGATGEINFTDTDIIFTRLGSAQLDGAYTNTSLVLNIERGQLENALVNGSTCSGVCLATVDAGLDFAYGRATLVNNYGSANEPLLLPFSTQYFDGQDWRVNANDSCTAYDHTRVNDASSDLVTENSGTLSQGSYVSGEGIRITSPNGEGEFFVTFDTPPWLLWDWSNNDVADEPPSATLTFGVYRGNDNIIYKREKIGN